MPATSYTDPATVWAAYALQDRTDESGSAVDDLNGEDMRIVLEAFTAGVLSTDAFQVREDSPTPGMTVRVGSGAAKSDVAILEGTEAGQGKYAVRLGDGVTDVTVPAADVSNPRIDEVYVVVQDDIYDSNGGNVVPRIGYRRGDAASNPSAPGPDGSWTAYLKLASIEVGAGVTEITDEDITDERVMSGPTPEIMSAWEIDGADVDTSIGAVIGTKVARATVTLQIPSSWNTWDCVAWATVQVGASDSTSVLVSVEIAGEEQEVWDVVPLALSQFFTFVSRRTGITGTGAQAIKLYLSGDGSAGLAQVHLYARAVRTS